MKLPLFSKLCWGILPLLASAMVLHADEKTDTAVAAAKEWLALIDKDEYRKSWNETAPFFQQNVPETQWEALLTELRKPLGEAKSRELLTATFATELPMAPKGEYVVIQFKTTFDKKPEAIETVTPMKDEKGTWRVAGYYIK